MARKGSQGSVVTTAEATATQINLLGDCGPAKRAPLPCVQMASDLEQQLNPAYKHGQSLLDLDGWAPRRTARKRAAHSERLGYRFSPIVRQTFTDDIYWINTSKEKRQGRPMTAGYHDRTVYGPNPVICSRHHVYTYGVLLKARLVAYLWLYRSGELALVSSILGHGQHLENDVMFLLFNGMCEDQKQLGGTVFYNRWDSGTDGLRFFKERLGLTEGDVRWTL